jgi:signal peptidase I
MNDHSVLTDDTVAEELRLLAAAAAPALETRPDLARQVLHRAGRDLRRRRARRAGIVAGAGLLVVVAAAASRPGSGSHFSVIQPSAAMAPTIAVGEQVVFAKRIAPQRGDVVSAHIDTDDLDHETISRVLAVAGDTIACPAGPTGQCSALVVNGIPNAESYLPGMAIAPFGPVVVPPASVFLVGDNRSNATDSRVYGPIADRAVSGVAVRIKAPGDNPRPVPGAPDHPAPGGAIDPAGPPPPASSTAR